MNQESISAQQYFYQQLEKRVLKNNSIQTITPQVLSRINPFVDNITQEICRKFHIKITIRERESIRYYLIAYFQRLKAKHQAHMKDQEYVVGKPDASFPLYMKKSTYYAWYSVFFALTFGSASTIIWIASNPSFLANSIVNHPDYFKTVTWKQIPYADLSSAEIAMLKKWKWGFFANSSRIYQTNYDTNINHMFASGKIKIHGHQNLVWKHPEFLTLIIISSIVLITSISLLLWWQQSVYHEKNGKINGKLNSLLKSTFQSKSLVQTPPSEVQEYYKQYYEQIRQNIYGTNERYLYQEDIKTIKQNAKKEGLKLSDRHNFPYYFSAHSRKWWETYEQHLGSYISTMRDWYLFLWLLAVSSLTTVIWIATHSQLLAGSNMTFWHPIKSYYFNNQNSLISFTHWDPSTAYVFKHPEALALIIIAAFVLTTAIILLIIMHSINHYEYHYTGNSIKNLDRLGRFNSEIHQKMIKKAEERTREEPTRTLMMDQHTMQAICKTSSSKPDAWLARIIWQWSEKYELTLPTQTIFNIMEYFRPTDQNNFSIRSSLTEHLSLGMYKPYNRAYEYTTSQLDLILGSSQSKIGFIDFMKRLSNRFHIRYEALKESGISRVLLAMIKPENATHVTAKDVMAIAKYDRIFTKAEFKKLMTFLEKENLMEFSERDGVMKLTGQMSREEFKEHMLKAKDRGEFTEKEHYKIMAYIIGRDLMTFEKKTGKVVLSDLIINKEKINGKTVLLKATYTLSNNLRQKIAANPNIFNINDPFIADPTSSSKTVS